MAANIAENLKRLRNGMTQDELEERSGIPQSSVSKYEKKGTIPDLKTALRLAVGLGVSLDALVDGLDRDYSSQQKARSGKSELDKGKTLARHQEDRQESPHPTPIEVGQAEQGGSIASTDTGTRGVVPPHRRPGSLHDRAILAAELLSYANALEQSDAVRTLRLAAGALTGGKDGTARHRRTGSPPRAGGSGGHHSRGGRR